MISEKAITHNYYRLSCDYFIFSVESDQLLMEIKNQYPVIIKYFNMIKHWLSNIFKVKTDMLHCDYEIVVAHRCGV